MRLNQLSVYPKKMSREVTIESAHHENGKIKSKIHYVVDKKHGLGTWWYENGLKHREVIYKDGEKHGLETWWYENGEKWYEKMWREGKKHGVGTWWHKEGIKGGEIYSAHGKDYATIFWDKEGNVTDVDFPTLTQAPRPIPTTTNPINKPRKSY